MEEVMLTLPYYTGTQNHSLPHSSNGPPAFSLLWATQSLQVSLRQSVWTSCKRSKAPKKLFQKEYFHFLRSYITLHPWKNIRNHTGLLILMIWNQWSQDIYRIANWKLMITSFGIVSKVLSVLIAFIAIARCSWYSAAPKIFLILLIFPSWSREVKPKEKLNKVK